MLLMNKMTNITTAFWSMTINNYDDTDLAMVQNGYPDYLREIVHTLEKGEEGTPHIQAWIKLQRQQRLSFVKRLFPRGHFRPLTSDEYNQNTKRYAQKLDVTAVSGAVHRFNDPLPDVTQEITSVIRDVYETHYEHEIDVFGRIKEKHLLALMKNIQQIRVSEKPKLAKFYVSAAYKTIVKEYLMSFLQNTCHNLKMEERENVTDTHTHTHSDEIFSQQDENVSEGGYSREDTSEHSGGEEDGEGDEDGESETYADTDESGSVSGGSSDVSEEY